ncbi:MAG TPA: hypothetical protein VF276_06870 [Chloroflexia bacterium]
MGALTYLFVDDQLINVQLLPAPTPAYVYVLLDQAYRGSPFINPIVYQYRADGSRVGTARVPLTGPHNRVTPQLAVGDDGSIYAARVQPDGIEIRQLRVFADPAQLPPVLGPPPRDLAELVAQSDAIAEGAIGPVEQIEVAGAGQWATQLLQIRRWWKSPDPAPPALRLIPAPLGNPYPPRRRAPLIPRSRRRRRPPSRRAALRHQYRRRPRPRHRDIMVGKRGQCRRATGLGAGG